MYISPAKETAIVIGLILVMFFVQFILPRIINSSEVKLLDAFHDGQVKDKEKVFAQSGRLADRYAHLQSVSGGTPASAPPAQMPVPEAAPAPDPMPAEQHTPPASAAEPALRKFCPYCGTENECDARFCHKCGAALPDLEDLE